MTRRLPILLIVLGFGSCCSYPQAAFSDSNFQTPLNSYIEGLRHHLMNSAAEEFSRICGVKLDEASHRFAFANDDAGTWRMVADLPDAYDNLDMDLVSTAEAWKNAAGTLIEQWDAALDVGGFSRTLYCFDEAGRLKALDAANYQIPEEGEPWGIHERWVRRGTGGFDATVPFQFIGFDEKPIPKPKLDSEYKAFVKKWKKNPPSELTIRELKLPSALFE